MIAGISQSCSSSNTTAMNTITLFIEWDHLLEARCQGGRPSHQGSDYPPQHPHITAPSRPPCVSIMTDKSQRRKGGGKAIPALNMAINGLNIAKEATSTTPVNPIFGSVAALLTMIRVSSVPFCDEIYLAHI